jgi:putative phosphoribosyl transferase
VERRVRLFQSDRAEADVRGQERDPDRRRHRHGDERPSAIGYLRKREHGYLVLAVPVCAAGAVEVLSPEVDELVSLKTLPELLAIGYWYEDFEQVLDEEVVDCSSVLVALK